MAIKSRCKAINRVATAIEKLNFRTFFRSFSRII